MNDMLSAALAAYDAGWMPIPLRTEPGQRKRPSLAWRSYQNERPSRDVVAEWFASDHNIGIITGRVSGLVVVDLDGHIDDPAGWLAYRGLPNDTPIASTGRGGAHVYYQHPGGVVANGVKLAEFDGITLDIRADGGYVVAPPSVHDTGAVYRWIKDPSTRLARFPQELGSLLARASEHGTIHASEFLRDGVDELLQPVRAGQRNHTAARVSGYWLRATKHDEVAAWHALRLWNTQNVPPLSTDELRRTFESIARRDRPVELDVETDTAGGDPLPVMDGASWATTVRHLPPRQGVPTKAVPGLNLVGGIVPRDLLILAGRPGMGKSTCAWNLVADVCLGPAKLPTVIFSTEMTSNDVARWMGAKIYGKDARSLSEQEWHGVCDLISRSPVSICDAGAVTADQITEIVKSRPDTRLVIVDHIQRVVGRNTVGDNRNLEVGRTAQLLKSLAKDMPCTVLALSQMNRASDQLGKPRLSSLRDSGEIEQEADAVVFLWTREENITVPSLPVQFYLAKNRHGELAEIDCVFHKAEKRFQPLLSASAISAERERLSYIEAVRRVEQGEE